MNQPEKKDNGHFASVLKTLEKSHSDLIITYLLVGGIFIIFLFLVIGFFVLYGSKKFSPNYQLPKSFILSTIVLLISSFSVYKCKIYFKEENIQLLRKTLEFTFILGLIFFALQVSGWKELQKNEIFLKGYPSGSFIYLISGLHGLHLLGGIGFILRIYLIVYRVTKDPVYALIIFTSPYEKIRLKMFSIYWHFMDLLWLLIFLIFLFAF